MVIVIIVITFIVTIIFIIIIIIINKITTPFRSQLSESDITFDIDIGPIVLEKNNTGKQLQNKASFFQLLSPNLQLRLENGAVYFQCLTFYRSQTLPL